MLTILAFLVAGQILHPIDLISSLIPLNLSRNMVIILLFNILFVTNRSAVYDWSYLLTLFSNTLRKRFMARLLVVFESFEIFAKHFGLAYSSTTHHSYTYTHTYIYV